MNGLVMQQPLLISSLLVHAERHHGDQEIVSRRVEGDIHRTTYRELAVRSRRMAKALAGLGVVRRRPGRDPGLERLPPPRAVLRGLGLRRGAAHAQSAPPSGPGGLHRRPRRGPGPVLRPDLPAADRGDRRARQDDPPLRRDDRPRAHAGELEGREPALLRGPARAARRPPRVADLRRSRRLVALLHRRAPPAIRRACCTATARRCCTPSRSRCPIR